MKNLRRLSVALVFTLALTIPTFAGEIETTVAGQIGTGSSEATAVDSATEIALNLIQSVLSLF